MAFFSWFKKSAPVDNTSIDSLTAYDPRAVHSNNVPANEDGYKQMLSNEFLRQSGITSSILQDVRITQASLKPDAYILSKSKDQQAKLMAIAGQYVDLVAEYEALGFDTETAKKSAGTAILPLLQVYQTLHQSAFPSMASELAISKNMPKMIERNVFGSKK